MQKPENRATVNRFVGAWLETKAVEGVLKDVKDDAFTDTAGRFELSFRGQPGKERLDRLQQGVQHDARRVRVPGPCGLPSRFCPASPGLCPLHRDSHRGGAHRHRRRRPRTR